MNYQLNTIVEMKKPHACGTNAWQIIRMGADIKIECTNCHRVVMMTRQDFEKRLNKIIKD
ncbi:DUF951 domain-containing protein [Oenococcus sicerae]|uniref:DUF951 domain-containing protein n=1 Tax=Oenococcus sicerae TaxID=2203724 RepID=A0AAJ1RAN1_9LACO|nr:DUF951 domain-containing protein [Oenococcus sicerae]MDN6900088.1 DUF951 domain-containing protein [Oenococcus sicerae]VDK14302.1 hypothetical protein OAL24_01112 [Oenococcus sicerae]